MGMGDNANDASGPEEGSPDSQQLVTASIEDSEAMKTFKKYQKRSKPEEWADNEKSIVEILEEVMKEGGPFKVKLKSKEMGKIRALNKKKLLVGGVGIEDPFADAVKKKAGIKYEIHRLIKRQNEIINSFNATAAMMPYIERMLDEDASDEEVGAIYENLVKLWKVSFIEQSKALYDIGKDLKDLQYRAQGLTPPVETPPVEIITEKDKEIVKEKREEKKTEAFARVSGVVSGGSYSGGSQYGRGYYGRGRGRGISLQNANRGRGRGRGSGSRG